MMTAFLTILGLGSLALSIVLLATGARWVLRQLNVDDSLDLEDFC